MRRASVACLLALLAFASSTNVHFVHPTCGVLVSSSSSNGGVHFRLHNRCAGRSGLRLDFSPRFDSPCQFDTCSDSSSENWSLGDDESVRANFPDFSGTCGAETESDTVYLTPIDCSTGKANAAVEQHKLNLDFSEGYSIEFRKNWWTPAGTVGLMFVTRTVNGKILSVTPTDSTIATPLNSQDCKDPSNCEQIWSIMLHRLDVKSFDMKVRLQTSRGIHRLDVTANVDIIPGHASEWQRAQVVDAILFTDSELTEPVYGPVSVPENNPLCVYAIAPTSNNMGVESVRLCSDENTCTEVSTEDSSNGNSSFFCIPAQKVTHGEQALEVDYSVDSAGLRKRSWTTTLTTVNGTVIKTRWIVIVECPDGHYWNGYSCEYHHHDHDHDHGHWGEGAWIWILVFLGIFLFAVIAFFCLSAPESWTVYNKDKKHKSKQKVTIQRK